MREQLIALMRKTAKRSPLEGVVFVGDIPIAMVRNAQHLTTAFKMDEDNFPMIQSSVPSDRYYDCPDLQFELIARDTTDRLLSYFNLACDSPQRLDPAFYSGRIRYPEQLGGDKYEGIARYLEKPPKLTEEVKIVRKSLSETLKENRTRCKMTQEFVAEALGVSRQAVSKWESGGSLR